MEATIAQNILKSWFQKSLDTSKIKGYMILYYVSHLHLNIWLFMEYKLFNINMLIYCFVGIPIVPTIKKPPLMGGFFMVEI